jgi:hypothetical protein
LHRLAAAERKQLLGQRRGSFRRLADLLGMAVEWVGRSRSLQQQFAVAEDGGEDIVEIVRHTAG